MKVSNNSLVFVSSSGALGDRDLLLRGRCQVESRAGKQASNQPARQARNQRGKLGWHRASDHPHLGKSSTSSGLSTHFGCKECPFKRGLSTARPLGCGSCLRSYGDLPRCPVCRCYRGEPSRRPCSYLSPRHVPPIAGKGLRAWRYLSIGVCLVGSPVRTFLQGKFPPFAG